MTDDADASESDDVVSDADGVGSEPDVVDEADFADESAVVGETMYHNEGVSPHAVLGLFMILVAGGIALSLVTAPPVAREQLHAAAANTMAASSFVLVDTTVVTSAGGAAGAVAGREVNTLTYQAPDKVREQRTGTSGSVSVIEIGAKRYESAGGGKWVQLPASGEGGPSVGEQAAADLLLPLGSLTSATDVVRSGQTYRFVPGNIAELLATFGLVGSRAQPVSASFSATVSGENATSLRIVATFGARLVVIDLDFDSIGTAPPVTAPPAGALLPPANLPNTAR